MCRLQQQKNILLTAVVGMLFAGAACHRPEASSQATSGVGTQALAGSAKAPFDVEAIIRQVHFAYREEGGGWHGGHSNYEVKATAQGLTLTPMHAKATESEPQVEQGAPLMLGPARVTRGDTRLSVETPRGQVEKDGHLVFLHGAVAEHLRNSERGVEQSWSFEAQPAGHGALKVVLEAKGLVHTGTSSGGLHFADARTGLGFQYGHGTWVDGKGRRTAVPAEYSHGQIHLRVPEEVLASSTYPAVLDPVVSSEMLIDGRLMAVDAAVRTFPVLAFNGTQYLLVWRSLRANLYNSIYATRVSSTGTVLDTSPIALSSGSGNSSDPQVATNGTDFYVVWSQNGVVRGTRFTPSGVVGDPGGKALTSPLLAQYLPRIASNGTDYLVTWNVGTTDGHYDVYARRVSGMGLLLDTSDIVISNVAGYDETGSVVASNGSVYLVAWSDSRSGDARAYATRVSSAGVVLDGTGFLLSGSVTQNVQAAASNGTDFLVTWLDYRNLGSRDLYGTRVTGSGTVVDTSGLPIGVTSSIQETNASIASDGTDYLVAWTSWNTSATTFQILGSRVSSSASSATAVLDTTSLVLSANAANKHASVTRANSGYLVAWDGTATGVTDLYNAWVSSAGSVSGGSGFPTSSVPTLSQTEPVVASNGTNYLVVWTETTATTAMIYGTRVTREGVSLDVPGLELAVLNRERQSPAVASNGTDYLVSWMDFRDSNWDIYAGRVLGSGSSPVLDGTGFAISTNSAFENAPAVASNGTDYLVSWRRDAGSRGDIYAARVTSAGVVQDTSAIAIATNLVEHYTPRVASNGTNYFVVWAEYQSTTAWDVYGARVSGAGVVLDPSGIAITTESAEQYDPDVASNGTDFFAVWTDYRSGTNTDVYGARVSGAGSVLDSSALALCTLTSHQYSPRVAFDGTNYVAAWADYRRGSLWAVFATQVTGLGSVVTSNGSSIVFSVRATEPYVALASGGSQQSMVVYSRYDTEPGTGIRRARGTFLAY